MPWHLFPCWQECGIKNIKGENPTWKYFKEGYTASKCFNSNSCKNTNTNTDTNSNTSTKANTNTTTKANTNTNSENQRRKHGKQIFKFKSPLETSQTQIVHKY